MEVTFSSGKYGIASCSGLKPTLLIEVRTICSIEINDGNKLWTELRRDKGESTAGVGKIVVVDAKDHIKNLSIKNVFMHLLDLTECFWKNKVFHR